MDTRRLEESSRLVGAVSWPAIASGTFIALAVQTVLLLLGLAFATSTGNGMPGAGYAVWFVIIELVAMAIGAALTARLSHADQRMSGMAAGVMTWAVVLVLGGVFQGLTLTRGLAAGGFWAAFVGSIAGLAAALVGGSYGARLGGPGSLNLPHDTAEYPTPMAPFH